MPGQKRDCRGKPRANEAPTVRNEFTPMFEYFRDELDAHHDRRERIIKASRDVTALSKKIIFSLQRVRKIEPSLPLHIQKETQSRLAEISKLLATIAVEVQGVNRYRYARQMSCVEELIEALTFEHYLCTQSLLGYDEVCARVSALSHHPGNQDQMDVDATETGDPQPPAPTTLQDFVVDVSEQDYLMGIFDLSGEMMRFATVIAALNGTMAGGNDAPTTADGRERTINADMQDLGSFFEMLPVQHVKGYQTKLDTMRQSVLKVERLGYGLKVRGSERPAGWMPDTSADGPLDAGYE